mgnify:CR=1 FL=1
MIKQPKVYIEELGVIAEVTAINYLEKEVEVYIKQNAVFDDLSTGFDFYSFDEVIFMENTGFKDKNRTSIFVGDIVKTEVINKVYLQVVGKADVCNAVVLENKIHSSLFSFSYQKQK